MTTRLCLYHGSTQRRFVSGIRTSFASTCVFPLKRSGSWHVGALPVNCFRLRSLETLMTFFVGGTGLAEAIDQFATKACMFPRTDVWVCGRTLASGASTGSQSGLWTPLKTQIHTVLLRAPNDLFVVGVRKTADVRCVRIGAVLNPSCGIIVSVSESCAGLSSRSVRLTRAKQGVVIVLLRPTVAPATPRLQRATGAKSKQV